MNTVVDRVVEATPWVLVADHAYARLFSAVAPTAPLKNMEELLNPSARRHEGDLASDSPGHIVAPAHSQGHAAAHETRKHHASVVFAQKVAERLDQLRQAGSISRLYVIAEPAFLGMLRASMTAPVRKLVVSELAKVRTHERGRDIRADLPQQL